MGVLRGEAPSQPHEKTTLAVRVPHVPLVLLEGVTPSQSVSAQREVPVGIL